MTQVRRQRHVAADQRVRLIHAGMELAGDQPLPPRPCVVHCTLTSAPRPEREPPPTDWVRLAPILGHERHQPPKECVRPRNTGGMISFSDYLHCQRGCDTTQIDAIGPRRLLKWAAGGFLAYANYSCFSGKFGLMAALLICVLDAAYILMCFPQLLVSFKAGFEGLHVCALLR